MNEEHFYMQGEPVDIVRALNALKERVNNLENAGMVKPKFLPCPFCGKPRGFFTLEGMVVRCGYCGALGPNSDGTTRENVEKAWNTRKD